MAAGRELQLSGSLSPGSVRENDPPEPHPVDDMGDEVLLRRVRTRGNPTTLARFETAVAATDEHRALIGIRRAIKRGQKGMWEALNAESESEGSGDEEMVVD